VRGASERAPGRALLSPQLRAENYRALAPTGRIVADRFLDLGLDPVSMRRRAPMRLGLLILVVAVLAACSDTSASPPSDATESAAMVQKNCADPHWREANLGLWYSVCRQPLRW
jgi:hypothetical protein